ncbi:MAG TPA: hypothetical protein PK566_16430 [Pseudobacteroides sp.]|nr:hypothetical protein [Pseudobacteroides sp.]
MKLIKRVYKWIVFSIIMQILVLAYFNYDFLLEDHEIKATSYEISDGTIDKKRKSIEIQQGATQLRVSHDGYHAAWLLKGKIHVYDLTNKKLKDTIEDESGDINYYRWLPDRNIIIYSISVHQSGKVNVLTKDIDTGNVHSYPTISGLAKNSEVKHIELSPLTNVVYVKIQTSSTKARIYKYDIMDNLSYIMLFGSSSKISEANLTDKLFYEDENGGIMQWDGKRKSKSRINISGKASLIGVDSNDNLYIGKRDASGKINKLLYKEQDKQSGSEWNEINLKTPCDENDIIVKMNEVYLVNRSNEVVINLKDDTEIKYYGEFIEILDNYIVYSKDEELIVDRINK